MQIIILPYAETSPIFQRKPMKRSQPNRRTSGSLATRALLSPQIRPSTYYGLDECFARVLAFQKRFSNPVAGSPCTLSPERLSVRYKYLKEELDELAASDEIAGQCDALMDIIYFALGGFAEMGVEPQAIFDIVHNANMNKLFPDGRPRHRTSDGKVAKPPNWQSPKAMILQEISRQLKGGTAAE